MGLITREQLREEDGMWIERPTEDELVLVFASGPVAPSTITTAELLDAALVGAGVTRPEQALALLHAVATSERRLLAAVAARWQAEQLSVAWVGDVRAHLLRGAQLLAHTREHTLARQLGIARTDSGIAAERVVVRILGGPDARVELERWSTQPGDRLLLCAPHLHDFRPPTSYLEAALDFSRALPGRLLVEANPPRALLSGDRR